ncbi:hypothetical protein FHS29_006599 [Saccharothrix tamanrassetensis]|uniref:DUF397 domain-containing protein n=1 Tax=Saccharothrix tamanrassetensis TaxID=1051531 RepID=A0A841CVD2_9PSEU|nr:DUF397 domain-containing protein [Saccharothrix tamanrassetensis]MBB5959977.1 hypothetical protein [Saccharothrix tamanrassetensis]
MQDTGWFKSSYSGAGNDQCVEVRLIAGRGAGIRDSKQPQGDSLQVNPRAWAAFLGLVHRPPTR